MFSLTVVGGSGFVGTRLVKRLKNSSCSYDISIVDKNISATYPELVKIADVRDQQTLCSVVENTNVLINLAAEHRDDVKPKSLYDEVNVQGARNLCDVARKKNISKIIFTSSVAVYGFAPLDTGEDGAINPFNDYGRTKYEAEQVFKEWLNEKPLERSLVIIRPTVIFGEQNRGNVYNLLKQIASGRFLMIGAGKNKKSMAYVENIAAFIEFSLTAKPGVHIYNYIDKPDLDMNTLVSKVNGILGKSESVGIRLPLWIGYLAGYFFDFLAYVTGKSLPISSIRVKKFSSNTLFSSSVSKSGFVAPVKLVEALEKTVCYEFVEKNENKTLFYSE